MTLDESINELMSLWPMTLADQEKLRNYLHAFAAAIQGEKGRCCDNGRMGDAHVCQKQPGAPQMTIEEAAKITLGHIPKCPKCAVSYPSDLHLEKCSWKQPTPELPRHHEFDGKLCDTYTASGCHCFPKEVQEKINDLQAWYKAAAMQAGGIGFPMGFEYRDKLESLAHLCLSMRAK